MLSTCTDVGICDGLISVCVGVSGGEHIRQLMKAFDGERFDRLMIVSDSDDIDPEKINLRAESISIFKKTSDAAKNIYSSMSSQKSALLCFGSLDFATEVKTEIVKLMSF